ncbi:lysophospholipid acyltransferase family protein [Desulfatiferula olefinivorans]
MTVIDRLAARIIYMVLFLIGSLPAGLSQWLSDGIGRTWFAFDRRHRTIAVDNITRAFGDTLTPGDIRRLARENFKQLSRLLFEVGWSLRLYPHDIKKHISIEGMENLTLAFREGRGVLFLTAHLGSWELLTLVPALIPYTIHDIYRPLDYPPLEEVITRFRTRFGMKLIAKEGAIRKMLKALARGEGVGIPLDQSVGAKDGVFADFFGRPTCTSKGMGLIALKTGVPVIPVFLVRRKGGFTVIFGRRIRQSKTGDTARDLVDTTGAFNAQIEAVIRRYPEQWFWVHNRWKTKMPGS